MTVITAVTMAALQVAPGVPPEFGETLASEESLVGPILNGVAAFAILMALLGALLLWGRGRS